MKTIRTLLIVLAVVVIAIFGSKLVYKVNAKALATVITEDDKNPDGDKSKKSGCCTEDKKDKGDCKKDEACCKDKEKENCCKKDDQNINSTTTTTKKDGCCKPKDLRE